MEAISQVLIELQSPVAISAGPHQQRQTGNHSTYLTACINADEIVCIIQWNPSDPDTNGPEEGVLIREVSLFQGYLGRKKVSCLERFPYFRQ